MTVRLRFALALLIGSISGLPSAAKAQEMALLPKQDLATVLACLVQPPPDETLKLTRKDGQVYALMRVKLRFEGKDVAPTVETLFSSASTEVAKRIQQHVAAYRLPCWTPEAGPVEAVQEFSLSGSVRLDGWSPGKASRASEDFKSLTANCKADFPPPSASMSKLAVGLPITFRAIISFPTDPLTAPTAQVLGQDARSPVASRLKKHIETYYRSDCPALMGRSFSQSFRFAAEGAGKGGFVNRSLDLARWLASVRDVEAQQPYFDFDSMRYPFSVKLRYWQPISENGVSEIDTRDPNRAAFLAWLATHQLNLPNAALEHLFDETTLINVPCGKLDLRQTS